MRSIGNPPMPPLALISSTAISMESFAVWPHSAPLPVNDARQPILTLRPESFCAWAFSVDDTNDAQDMMAATASDAGSRPGTLIAPHLPEFSYPQRAVADSRCLVEPIYPAVLPDLGTSVAFRVWGLRVGLLPKVGLLHLGRVEKLPPRSAQGNPASLHHIAAVGDLQRLARVLLDEEDRLAFLLELTQDQENSRDELGGEAQRRLIEQQQRRARHQRATDREHLLFAAAQRGSQLVTSCAQGGKPLKDRIDVSADLRIAARECAHAQVIEHRHALEDGPAFRHLAEAQGNDFVRRTMDDALASEFDPACRRPYQAGDGFQKGRLTRTVRADQSNDLPPVDRQANIVQHFDFAVPGPEPHDGEHRHRSTSSPR